MGRGWCKYHKDRKLEKYQKSVKKRVKKVTVNDKKVVQFKPPPVKQLPAHYLHCDCGGSRQCFYTGEKFNI